MNPGGAISAWPCSAPISSDLDIQAEDVVHDLLRDLALDADALIGRAKTEAVKESLRRQVDRARNLGLFGAPTFFVGDEMFWGNDRLEDALEWAQQGPAAARATARVAASA